MNQSIAIALAASIAMALSYARPASAEGSAEALAASQAAARAAAAARIAGTTPEQAGIYSNTNKAADAMWKAESERHDPWNADFQQRCVKAIAATGVVPDSRCVKALEVRSREILDGN